MILIGESRRTLKKNQYQCQRHFSITDPTWTGLDANPDLRDKKPATNRRICPLTQFFLGQNVFSFLKKCLSNKVTFFPSD